MATTQNLGSAEAEVRLDVRNFIRNSERFQQSLRDMATRAEEMSARWDTVQQGISDFSAKINGGALVVAGGVTGLAKIEEDMKVSRIQMAKEVDLTGEELKKYENIINDLYYGKGLGEEKVEVKAVVEFLYKADKETYKKDMEKLRNDASLVLANKGIEDDLNEYLLMINSLKQNVSDIKSVKDAINFSNEYFTRIADPLHEQLDWLTEYPEQYGRWGVTGAEIIDIAMMQQESGTYKDYGFDAVKEFGILLTKWQDYEDALRLIWDYDLQTEDIKAEMDNRIASLRSEFDNSATQEERKRKMGTYLANTIYAEFQKNQFWFDEKGTDLFSTLNEEAQGLLTEFMGKFGNLTLGADVVINQESAEETQAAIENAKIVTATTRQLGKAFIDSGLTKAMYDLFASSLPMIKLSMEWMSEFLAKVSEVVTKIAKWAEENPETFKKLFGAGVIGIVIINVLNLLGMLIGGILAISPVIISVFGGLSTAFTWVNDKVIKPLGKAITKLWNKIPWASIGAFFAKFATVKGALLAIGKILSRFIPYVGWILLAIDLITLAYKTNFLGFKDLVDKIWNKIKELGAKFWEWYKKTFMKIWGPVIEFVMKAIKKFQELKDKVTEKFEEIKNKISDKIEEIIGKAVGIKDRVVEAFRSAFEGAYEKVKYYIDLILGFVDDVKAGIDTLKNLDVKETAKTIGSNAKDWIGDKFNEAKSFSFNDMFTGGFNPFKPAIANGISIANSFIINKDISEKQLEQRVGNVINRSLRYNNQN